MRGKRNAVLTAALAASIGVIGALAPALAANAAQSSVILGPKTCTGSSHLASKSYATIHVQHKIVNTAGAVAIRSFTNYTGTYQNSYYYPGMQGSVIYNGNSYVQITPTWESGTIGTASLFCDV